MFNEAVPSLLITAGEVAREEEEPQHLYHEGGFVDKLLPVLLGFPCRELVLLTPPAALSLHK